MKRVRNYLGEIAEVFQNIISQGTAISKPTKEWVVFRNNSNGKRDHNVISNDNGDDKNNGINSVGGYRSNNQSSIINCQKSMKISDSGCSRNLNMFNNNL